MITMPSLRAMSAISKESTLEISKEASVVGMVVLCGRMESSSRGSGARVRRMEGGYGNHPKAIAIKVSGGTTGKMAEGATSTQAHLNSTDILRIF
jgi:hypothetical protein